jgi:hypothetical protein
VVDTVLPGSWLKERDKFYLLRSLHFFQHNRLFQVGRQMSDMQHRNAYTKCTSDVRHVDDPKSLPADVLLLWFA